MLAKLFNPKEFFEDNVPKDIVEVNIVSDAKKFEPLDLQIKGDRKNKPSVEEPLQLKLKPLPNHLKFACLMENDTLPIIIFVKLNVTKEKVLLTMLKHRKKVIG